MKSHSLVIETLSVKLSIKLCNTASNIFNIFDAVILDYFDFFRMDNRLQNAKPFCLAPV